MSESAIRVEQIEGLEDYLRTILRQEMTNPPLDEDVEKLKKTPAGAVIRLEEQVKAVAEDVGEIKSQIGHLESRMNTKFDGIENRFDNIESRMATKDDLEQLASKSNDIESRMATKDDLLQLEKRFDNLESNTMAKFDNIESRMATKDQIEKCATKNELNLAVQEIKGIFNALDVRIEEQGKRLAFFQVVTYSIFGVFFAMMVAILVKLFF